MKSEEIKKFLKKRKESHIIDIDTNKGMAAKKIKDTFLVMVDYFKNQDKILNNLLRKSSVGFFGHSELYHIFNIFKEINLKKYWSFLDLGSGDGRIVLIASMFTKSTGFEFDNDLYKISLNNKEKLEKYILNTIKFQKCDYTKKNISEFDIVFLNPDKPFDMDNLEKLLHKNYTNYLIDITLFEPRFMKKDKEFTYESRKYGLYIKK